MRRSTVRRLSLLLLCMGCVAPAAAVAEEAPAPDVYVRGERDVPETLRWLRQEAERIGASQVLLAFDLATFSPPPGHTEFSAEYGFFEDRDDWVAAIASWPQASRVPLRVTTSLAPRTIPVGAPGWREDLDDLLARTWWQEESFAGFEPAAKWMGRMLLVSDRPDLPRPRMVALVAGTVTPERWVPQGTTDPYEAQWRSKLLPVGSYFDPEVVGSRLAAEGARLYVVAPEARFADFTPYPEMPQLPWASRPQFPPLGNSSLLDLPVPEDVRRRLDEAVAEALRRARGPTTPGDPRPRVPTMASPTHGGLRFRSTTPVWFPRSGDIHLWNCHAPSGYGQWPYARAAARTGGRHLFYPFPPSRWLDRCPADFALVNRLGPELVSPQAYLSLRPSDAALDALCRAAAKCVPMGFWADTHHSHQAASGWSAFARPSTLQPDWFLRRMPFDDVLYASEDSLERKGERVAEQVLPAYDEAIALVESALAAEAAAPAGRSPPRSVANLHLARFWFAMSAFHLEAYAIYAREWEQRFLPASMRGHVDQVLVTYVTTLRMSDCLDAYDGRTLSPADEAAYPRWVPEDAPGYQGNLLQIPTGDPNYRARRDLDRVLLHLDPRLRRRALRMIHAAGEVMKRYARSGWGWTTYYSDAYTFIFEPAPRDTGHRPTPGGGSRPPPPTTPRGPSSGGGGSTPGGPKTK